MVRHFVVDVKVWKRKSVSQFLLYLLLLAPENSTALRIRENNKQTMWVKIVVYLIVGLHAYVI